MLIVMVDRPKMTGKSPHSCLLTPPILLLGMMLRAVRYILGQLGSAGPALFLPNFLRTPSPLFGG